MIPRLPVLLGAAVVAAHAALLPVAIDACRRPPLEVRIAAPVAADELTVEAEIPAELAHRVERTTEGAGPGLRHVSWAVRYRGGIERSAGFTQLVGPFQDPAAPPCALRVVVGQAFLDRLEPMVRAELTRQLAGFEQFPIGDFERIARVELRWASREAGDRIPRRRGADAALHVAVTVRFERAAVAVDLALYPRIAHGELTLDHAIDAAIDWDSRILQRASDLLGGDRLARLAAGRELDAGLKSILAPPPELPLPGGATLRFDYCPDAPITATPGGHIAVPLALQLESAGAIAPIATGPWPLPDATSPDAPLALDLTADVLNGVLHELWRTGYLDRQLDDLDLEARFNADPLVQALLSVRVADLDLPLPPVLEPTGSASPDFWLAAETAVTLADGPRITPARLYGRIGARLGTEDSRLGVALSLTDLHLTCHPEPALLTPCYGDLVAALRDQAGDLHGELTRLFTDTFTELVIQEAIVAPDLGTFRIEEARLSAPAPGLLRVSLDGSVAAD